MEHKEKDFEEVLYDFFENIVKITVWLLPFLVILNFYTSINYIETSNAWIPLLLILSVISVLYSISISMVKIQNWFFKIAVLIFTIYIFWSYLMIWFELGIENKCKRAFVNQELEKIKKCNNFKNKESLEWKQ